MLQYEVSEFVTAVIPTGVPMADDWAVEEVFCGVCRAEGCIEAAADYGHGICRAFLH